LRSNPQYFFILSKGAKMLRILTKIRGADIKEIEIFMLLVTVWVLVLLSGAYFFPGLAMDSAILLLLNKHYAISCTIFLSASFITLLGIFTYLGKFVRFIAPWLLLSGIFWGGMSLLMLIFQPFTIIFGVCAFLTSTSFHLFTLQVRERTPKVMCRKDPSLCRKHD